MGASQGPPGHSRRARRAVEQTLRSRAAIVNSARAAPMAGELSAAELVP